MPENAVNPVSNEAPEFVQGEIVGVEETRIRVRLESGGTGYMRPPEGVEVDAIRVGRRATFRIVASDSAGSPTLAFAESRDAPTTQEPFDREVVRLHDALANHPPANSARPAERVYLGEEQIRDWIDRVERSLGRFRKNRAKRLDEEFYNGS